MLKIHLFADDYFHALPSVNPINVLTREMLGCNCCELVESPRCVYFLQFQLMVQVVASSLDSSVLSLLAGGKVRKVVMMR